METRFLLRNKFKQIGWIFLVPSAIPGLFQIVFLAGSGFKFFDLKVFTIYSGDFALWDVPPVVLGFDKVNLTGTIIGVLFILGATIVAFAMIFNMFTLIVLFIIRFNYVLYRSTKLLRHEK